MTTAGSLVGSLLVRFVVAVVAVAVVGLLECVGDRFAGLDCIEVRLALAVGVVCGHRLSTPCLMGRIGTVFVVAVGYRCLLLFNST